ncbi:MAG: UDP-N-acetylglucosamine 4,6-dehydratase (inverting) [Bacteroidia bacterium]|nr:UDP-N-acetylglucosamine 4,6-dehydratase (inverting) [Bacteroidia bacterium]
MLDLNHKTLLVTGGTGSFGYTFIQTVLERYPQVKRIIIYSRDEHKQFEMALRFQHPALEYRLGDVRDLSRLKRACEGVDILIHSAAIKHVATAELNPFECIKTNILGAENIIEAAFDCGIKKVVALSSDKATAPINLYGATKLCADKLFVAAQNITGNRDLTFSVVRYGNVLGSRGSVVPIFLEQRKKGKLPITHPEMTRFINTPMEGVELVLFAIEHAWGGEIFIPKIPAFRVIDLAEAIAPNCQLEIIGIRPGEKLHEEMLTEMDSINTIEFDRYFILVPPMPQWSVSERIKAGNGKPVPIGFRYHSNQPEQWLSVEELREQIRLHVDATFQVYCN